MRRAAGRGVRGTGIGRPAWALALTLALAAWLIPPPPRGPGAGSAFAAGEPLFLPIANPETRALAAPRFDPERGLFDRPFDLSLASDAAGAIILFTTDGSLPEPGRGRRYEGPIRIETTTVLRAMAFRAGFLPSPVATHSFVFPDRVPGQPDGPPGFPPTWGLPPEDPAPGPVRASYGMHPGVVGDPLYRDRIGSDLRALPSVSLVAEPADLFDPERGIHMHPASQGRAWERPVSVELIPGAGPAGFQVDAGLRIAGVASRNHRHTLKKSFSLRFRAEYGPARLAYPLFPGRVTRFDTLRLRAGFNDSFPYLPGRGQYLRDAWARASQRDMGWLSARGRFVHLYLNGLYWGLYELTEEPTAAFAADHLGGDPEDYDVVKDTSRGEDGLEDGDRTAYEALLALENLADPVQYERAAALLDLAQHADYILLQIYGANQDWPLTNWRAARNRQSRGAFQFFVWDFEMGLDLLHPSHGLYVPDQAGDKSGTDGVDGLHGRLLANPEYRLLFADRARRHLLGGGVLSAARAAARYAGLAAQIDRAIVGESARWGGAEVGPYALSNGWRPWHDYWRLFGFGHPQTRDDEWAQERDRLLNGYFPGRSAVVLDQLCRQGLYPPLGAPVFDPPGAGAEALTRVRIGPAPLGESCPGAPEAGRIYFTLDGSDPRDPWSGMRGVPFSGRPSAGAQVYGRPVAPGPSGLIRARAALWRGDHWTWSALSELSIGQPRLLIDELMYHPPDPTAEFLELVNLGPGPADLSGAAFDGIDYLFPPGSRLAAGERLVLVADPEAFLRHHPGVRIGGVYGGRLANEGETLVLHGPLGHPLARLRYDDEGFWPLAPDGQGFSLVRAGPGGDPDDPEGWRASAQPGGSPGAADAEPGYRPVRINEILANSAPPFEDAIELHNPGPDTAEIGGWFLSDDRNEPRRFRIPDGSRLEPGGYAVFYEAQLRAGGAGGEAGTPGSAGRGFALGADGEAVFLRSAEPAGRLTGFMTGLRFGASPENQSLGRVETSAGPVIAPLAQPSFGSTAPDSVEAFRRGTGAPNGAPWVGPVLIDEILYRPIGDAREFVELFNRGEDPVDLGGATPSEAWRFSAGIDFRFPAGARIAPGGRLLVVAGDPAAFRLLAGVPEAVPVLGPFGGSLDDGGEALVLARPAGPEAPEGAWIEADRVDYDDLAPWPQAAAGAGPSLEKLRPEAFGRDPAAWAAYRQGGTPGRAGSQPVAVFLPVTVQWR